MNMINELCKDLERIAVWFDGDSLECMNGAAIIRIAIQELQKNKRIPLTHEQIEDIAPVEVNRNILNLVRAVEAAHGIEAF